MNDKPQNDHTPPTKPTPSAQVSIGHTERVAANPGEDPVARHEKEKAEQAAKTEQAIANTEGSVRDKVIAAIQEVYDPEIPLNIYELGLIYEVEVDEKNYVKITMTLTSPACPVAQDLPLQVRQATERVPEVTGSEIDLTFDPPWSPERMSEAARLQLGLL